MGEYIDTRTDEEILSKRVTVQLYHKKILFLFEQVLESDPYKLGRFIEAVLVYTDTNGKTEILNKEQEPVTWAAFQQYKFELDKGTEQFIERSRKNSENAKRPRKSSNGMQSLSNASDRSQWQPSTENEIENDSKRQKKEWPPLTKLIGTDETVKQKLADMREHRDEVSQKNLSDTMEEKDK